MQRRASPILCLWRAMAGRAVFLVGFMGSGKSSVGRELANRLDWKFVDLDRQIEVREQKSIPQIFDQHDEQGFRAAETAALLALLDLMQSMTSASVIALGGGAFGQPANRQLISDWPTVFLDSSLDELWNRCSEDESVRPLRRDRQQFSRLYEERLPSYRQATITVVTSGRDISSICAEIEGKLNLGKSLSSDVLPKASHPANSVSGGSR